MFTPGGGDIGVVSSSFFALLVAWDRTKILIPARRKQNRCAPCRWTILNTQSDDIKMTLHEAIEQLLKQTGRQMTTKEIADDLNKNKWYVKKDGSKITDFQIHGRTKNYPTYFTRDGSTVSLVGQGIKRNEKANIKLTRTINPKTSDKDEKYVIDLCDKILGLTSIRQHKFDFLLGDKNIDGSQVKLPVDSFYPELGLVVEYRERQHTEKVNFFDKPDKVTVSGVHRGEQRKIYDERRRKILPENGVVLVEISYADLVHDSQKRLIRDKEKDEGIIREILKRYIDRGT